ncbi:uncharacterized protein LOC129350316 [Amphiprion ocellaris]|uniref:uncharacterized protein LOC129350316 n=1 Tax=Amphiprion ocellaris TaxID=80972 RepID=UPI0024114977|nr:uncharacterized protein LOC129350316 [Amphiprion ocellaris]
MRRTCGHTRRDTPNMFFSTVVVITILPEACPLPLRFSHLISNSFGPCIGSLMWLCKDCGAEASKRSEILKHCRLSRHHLGRGHCINCVYPNCPCIFKTWNSLLTHLSRNHCNALKCSDKFTLSCQLCGFSELGTERDCFAHITQHLKNYETVTCMFKGCYYKSNIYSTFKSHRSRKHSLQSVADFKDEVVKESVAAETAEPDVQDNEEFSDSSQSDDISTTQDQKDIVEQKLAAVLLKLGNIFHVPSAAFDELLEELQYLLSTACFHSTTNLIQDTLNSYSLEPLAHEWLVQCAAGLWGHV